MAATTVAELINKTRRFVRDYPDEDVLTASLSSSGSTMTVAAATDYADNWVVEIDYEAIVVTSTASSGTTVNIRRAARGSTATTHTSGSVILKRPHFLAIEIVDALNAGLEALYPYVYKPVVDESLSATTQTYEYNIPSMPSDSDAKIYHLSEVSIQETGDETFYGRKDWSVLRGSTPKLRFRHGTDSTGTIRLYGYGPFPRLTTSSSVDTLFPRQAEEALVLYAASELLASGEAGRVRVDRGATDSREQANTVGSSMRASQQLYTRFLQRRQDAAMAPLPRHVRSII